MSGFRAARIVKRKFGGQYLEGVWVEGTETEMTLILGIQPASPEVILNLPEGRKTRPTFVVFCDDELMPQSDDGRGDVVVSEYGNLEVFSVEAWQSGIIPHYKAIAQRTE